MVGVFGGTFDPIHFGHLRLAEELADALALDEVRFIPSRQPPHRPAPVASISARCEMVQRAIAGNPRFALDTREAGAGGPRYTVDTLAALRREVGEEQPLCLLLGADAFLGLPEWHDWRRLFSLAHIGVAQRPGYRLEAALPAVLHDEVATRWRADGRLSGPAGRVSRVENTPLAISASAVRAALKQRASVRYLLPDNVLDYLHEQQLYQA